MYDWIWDFIFTKRFLIVHQLGSKLKWIILHKAKDYNSYSVIVPKCILHYYKDI